jgi:3-hydroxyisobutyrate dehydrogenase-like beta-hydroxyacid dehydrogenase
MKKVGLIGLGVMGKRMGRNLLKHGYGVVVYNRSRPAVEEMAKEGAVAAASPKEVATLCKVTLLSLPTPTDVLKVVLAKNTGLVQGLSRGGIVVDTSTTDPKTTINIANELKKRRESFFLDAPVSGGPEGAEAGSLTIMVGGERSAFQRCRKILKVIGKSVFYLGGSGSGQKVKLVNQALVAAYFVACAEAYHWSQEMGVERSHLLKVITSSWGDSPVFRHFIKVVGSGNFEDGATLRLLKKDTSLILSGAKEGGFTMPLLELVNRCFSKASSLGYDNLDASSLVLTI